MFHPPKYFFNDSMSYQLEENFENRHNKEYRLPSLVIMKLISFQNRGSCFDENCHN